jgi:hypothetical protein
MVRSRRSGGERVFTVELASQQALRKVSVGNEKEPGVLIEGSLGPLKSVSFRDGVVLEVAGVNGTLRIDLLEEEVVRRHRRIRQRVQGRARAHS